MQLLAEHTHKAAESRPLPRFSLNFGSKARQSSRSRGNTAQNTRVSRSESRENRAFSELSRKYDKILRKSTLFAVFSHISSTPSSRLISKQFSEIHCKVLILVSNAWSFAEEKAGKILRKAQKTQKIDKTPCKSSASRTFLQLLRKIPALRSKTAKTAVFPAPRPGFREYRRKTRLLC